MIVLTEALCLNTCDIEYFTWYKLLMKRPFEHIRLVGPLFKQSKNGDVKDQAKSLFNEVYRDNPIDPKIPLKVTKSEKVKDGQTIATDFLYYDDVEEYAYDMIDVSVDSMDVKTQNPTTLAASTYYAASLMANVKITRSEVADMFSTTGQTITKHYTNMLEVMERAAIEDKLD